MPPIWNHTRSILLVEDDSNDVLLLKLAFEKAEVRNPITVARDGQEAIDHLSDAGEFLQRAGQPLPSLLILDLKMPRMGGMDVLRWLGHHPLMQCIPIIVLSSSAHRCDLERAYRLGANAFVVKPASNDERLQLARSIKSFWLEFNQPPVVCTDGFDVGSTIHAELDDSTGL